MVTVIESEQEQLDIDSISEYVRDQSETKVQSKSYAKDLFESAGEVMSVARAIKSAVLPTHPENESRTPDICIDNNVSSDKPDVLETLWPGVHHDFSHSVTVKRTPSYYLTLGFMGGAVLALILAWGFSAVSSLFANFGKVSPNVVTQNKATNSAPETLNTSVKTPIASTYEVKEGDTLAAIALQNYKHVSPRLMDEICKANNLTDANVLNLGQKLVLPEYHY